MSRTVLATAADIPTARALAPAAHLFPNGNGIFFDEAGEQITELQIHGLSGVHGFVERYPDAPVYWSIWGVAEQEVFKEMLPGLLEHITRPPEES